MPHGHPADNPVSSRDLSSRGRSDIYEQYEDLGCSASSVGTAQATEQSHLKQVHFPNTSVRHIRRPGREKDSTPHLCLLAPPNIVFRPAHLALATLHNLCLSAHSHREPGLAPSRKTLEQTRQPHAPRHFNQQDQRCPRSRSGQTCIHGKAHTCLGPSTNT